MTPAHTRRQGVGGIVKDEEGMKERIRLECSKRRREGIKEKRRNEDRWL